MGVRKNCVAVNKRSPLVTTCEPLRALFTQPVKEVPTDQERRPVGCFRGMRGEAGESTGAFAAPVRSQPPAVRAVSGPGTDAFLWADIFD